MYCTQRFANLLKVFSFIVTTTQLGQYNDQPPFNYRESESQTCETGQVKYFEAQEFTSEAGWSATLL